MNIQLVSTRTVNAKTVRVTLAVRYDDDDIPYHFPLRIGDIWKADIDIDTGRITAWPEGESGRLHMKVCDEGTYELLDDSGAKIAAIENNYVPHGLIPGSYGDYVDLQIDETGTITNWPKSPNLDAFFREGCI